MIRKTVFPTELSISYLETQRLQSFTTYPIIVAGGDSTLIYSKQDRQQQQSQLSGLLIWMTSRWVWSINFISNGRLGPQQFLLSTSMSSKATINVLTHTIPNKVLIVVSNPVTVPEFLLFVELTTDRFLTYIRVLADRRVKN